MIFLYAVLAVAAGVSFAVQGPVNTALGRRTDSFFATTVSFSGGMMLLLILCAVDRFGNMRDIVNAEPWMLFGGFYGAFGVCVSITVIPVLGVALSLIVIMLGQLLTGAVLDYFGWLGVARCEISFLRVLGIAVIALGIYLIFLDKRNKSGKSINYSGKYFFYLLLALFSGITGGLQSPTNAALASVIGSWEGTLMSFVTGFSAIAVITLFRMRGKKVQLRGKGIKSWMVIGGAYGVCGVFLNMVTVQHLGAALQSAGSTLGQLLCGVLIDSTGILQSEKVKVTKLRLSGVAAVTLGVLLVTLAKL